MSFFDDKEVCLNKLRVKLSDFSEATRISLIEAQSELDAKKNLENWLQETQTKLKAFSMNSLPLNADQLTEALHKTVLLKIDVKGL